MIVKLPYPPTVNTYYAVVRGRKILSKKGRQYKQDAVAVCMEEGIAGTLLTSRLEMKILAVMPDKRKRDLDNILKAIKDALTDAGVYEDDSQIDKLTIERGAVTKPGWVTVGIKEIE